MNLKPNRNRLRIAALTFLCGLALNWAFNPAAPEMTSTTDAGTLRSVEPPAATSRKPAGLEDEVKYVGPFTLATGEYPTSGFPLELDYSALDAQLLSESKILPLPSGRILAAAGNTVYMLGGTGTGQTAWSHTEPQPIFDVEYVAATNLVYVTAGDNQLLILDAWAGRQLHRESRQGRSGFKQTVAYGRDVCLVTDDNSGYRAAEDFIPPMSDGVTAWRGTKMLWHRELPPDAELRVSGDRIFAVTKTRSRVLVTELNPPPASR